MTRVAVDLQPGLISDDTPYSTTGTYRDCDNMRFVKGKPETLKGWERVSYTPVQGACRNVLSYKDLVGVPYIALGTHTHLYAWNGGTLADITPAGYVAGNIDGLGVVGYGTGAYGYGPYGQYTSVGDYHARTWSLDTYGEWVLATPRQQPIYLWQKDINTPAIPITSLPGATHIPPVANTAIVSQYRSIVAFGCNQELDSSGNAPGPYNPLCIRGSDIGGNITTWNVSTANNSFEYTLPSGGMIVAGHRWVDRLAVWTLSGLWLGTFQDNDAAPIRFDLVDGSVGLAGPNACVVIGEALYWVSQDKRLWMCTLGGSPSQVICPIQDDTLSQIPASQFDKINLCHYASSNELRIDYPDGRLGNENSNYLLYNYVDQTWARGYQCRTAMVRGTVIEFPVGADIQDTNVPYLGQIVDLPSAQVALAAIKAALGFQDNLVTRANFSSVQGGSSSAAVDLFSGVSSWGIRLTFDGPNARQGRISGLGLTAGQVVSISYQIQCVLGPDTTGTISLGSDYSTTIAATHAPMTLKHENITVSADDTLDFTFNVPPVTQGSIIEITNIKVEVSSQATMWSPAPTDTTLYSVYNQWLSTTTYPQVIGYFYDHESGNTADGNALSWYLESNSFSLDEDVTSMVVKCFFPDFKDQMGDVRLYLYFRMDPQSPEVEYGPWTVTPTTTRVNFLKTGRVVRYRLEGSDAPAFVRIGKPLFEVVPAGKR